jgi:hypothetical protein
MEKNKIEPDYISYNDDYEKLMNTIYESKKSSCTDFLNKENLEKEEEQIRKTLPPNQIIQDWLLVEDYKFIIDEGEMFLMEQRFNDLVASIDFSTKMQIVKKIDSLPTSRNSEVKPAISPLNSIENMVEGTYLNSYDMRFHMAEQMAYLRLLTTKWRPIKGDGNCFYRSVIFSYLENIIFEKDVQMLKKIAIEINEKFSSNYPNTSRLNYVIRNSLINIDKSLVNIFFTLIIEELDSIDYRNVSQMNSKVKRAYEILLKAFNYSVFDNAMILYLRYLLYEYIQSNQNRILSQDFPVLIGNLLPFQYETDDSKFLWDKFYNEELLKYYTYAEKIAIYLSPYVLKVNLNVVFYDYGPDCNIQTKLFKCHLENKPNLSVLYRKAHYDTCYASDYYQKYQRFLDTYADRSQGRKVVSDQLFSYYIENIGKVDIEQSQIFSKTKKKEEVKKEAPQTQSKTESAPTANTTVNNTTNNDTSANNISMEIVDKEKSFDSQPAIYNKGSCGHTFEGEPYSQICGCTLCPKCKEESFIAFPIECMNFAKEIKDPSLFAKSKHFIL